MTIKYKGCNIHMTYSSHPDHLYEVYWRNGTRCQRCRSVEEGKELLISQFSSHIVFMKLN